MSKEKNAPLKNKTRARYLGLNLRWLYCYIILNSFLAIFVDLVYDKHAFRLKTVSFLSVLYMFLNRFCEIYESRTKGLFVGHVPNS